MLDQSVPVGKVGSLDSLDLPLDVVLEFVLGDVGGLIASNVLDHLLELLVIQIVSQLVVNERHVLQFQHSLALGVQKVEGGISSLSGEGVSLNK